MEGFRLERTLRSIIPAPSSTRCYLGKDFEKGALESEPSARDRDMEAGNAEH